MTGDLQQSSLAYFARIGAALFPIPFGSKMPGPASFWPSPTDPTHAASFAHDWSADATQWNVWYTDLRCNFGLVAGPSRLIILDIDTHSKGRDEAWAEYAKLCKSWGLSEPPLPQVQSARGGWHVLFRVPDSLDASTLRQPDAVRKLINVRAGNGYVVAVGSYYDGTAKGEDSGWYQFLTAEPADPCPAPQALLDHCTRAANHTTDTAPRVGTLDPAEVGAMLRWLTERDSFSNYEDWRNAGMAVRLEFGDAGLELWRITHNETVTDAVEVSQWQSFATEPKPGVVTVASLIKRASDMGWRGHIGPTTKSMFTDAVAQLAQNAGATLASQAGVAIPMMQGQLALTRIATPLLADFLAATAAAPIAPSAMDYPALPASMADHGLYMLMQDCIARTFALEKKRSRAVQPMAVLHQLHEETFNAVARRCTADGHELPLRKIKLISENIREQVERACGVSDEAWIYDPKNGEIQHDNSDNVMVFLGVLDLEVRYNAWLERMEIRGGVDPAYHWDEWTYVDDRIISRLRSRGNRTKMRFKPGKDFFWDALIDISSRNTVDPALDALAALEKTWDGTPRLATWLARACHVSVDPYHIAVARNIIGGMVRRIRHPGCKHDTMAVFFGFQGSSKSTMARTLALQDEWFTDSVRLGEEAKELIQLLAGKCVVEIGEMGMRGSANAADIKAMISRQTDEGRTAYSRATTQRPRRNIFIGTTNDDEPLSDPTGNRRFLPVAIEREIDLTWLRENISQIIAEAAVKETTGDDFQIPREIWGIAAEHQEAARSESDVEILLGEWFAPTEFTRDLSFIYASDLIKLAGIAGFRQGSGTLRHTHMKRLGFASVVMFANGKTIKAWVRGKFNKPREIVKKGIRYVVGVEQDGSPRVTVRREIEAGIAEGDEE